MKKTLRSVMMAGAAMVALGASGQTLETVWSYTENIPGSAGGGEYRLGAAADGKLIVTNKAGKQIVYWDETNQGAVLHDMNEFFAANFATESTDAETGETTTSIASAGIAINADDAGNIIVNTNFPNAPSSTEWIIIPADGSEMQRLTLDLSVVGLEAARCDQLGRVVGNVLSDEGGYMWIACKDLTQVAIIKVINGVQDDMYVGSSSSTGKTLDTSTLCQPLYGTVAEVDALMDEEGDMTKSFWMRQRGSNNVIFYWGEDASAGMQLLSLTGSSESGQSSVGGGAEGFEVFTLQGKTYFVVPMGDTTGKNRDAAFGVYGEDGKLVASYTALSKAGIGQYNSFAVEACDENSVYIYRWLPSVQAAKFKFTVAAVPPAELPVATFTFIPDGTSQAEIGLWGTAAGQKVVVDWGDGVKSDSITIADPVNDWSATSIMGVPAGDGVVKLYGKVEEIGQLDCSWGTGQLKMQAIDVTGLTATTAISVISHDLTAVDLSKNVALTALDLSSNKLTALDLAANTGITKLVLSNTATNGENRLQGIDLSKLTALTNLQLAYNELTSIDLAANTTLATLNLTGNKFETIDLSAFTTIKTLNLPMNNLTEVKLPSTFPAKSYVYIQNNKLKLSTLPAQPENVTRYTYAPQQEVEISIVDGKVDLSTETMVGENATVFTWYDSEGNELVADTDYTAENGVFSFLKNMSGVYCTMANAAFASFTGNNILKTTVVDATVSGVEGVAVEAEEVPAVYYNLQGVQVENPAGGLYIVKRGNKVSKELIVK